MKLTCMDCGNAKVICTCNSFKETITIPKEDYEALIKLSKKLLASATICMKEQAPIQPFFTIVKDNATIIGKLKLFD